jgi:deoxyribodipyrimidine photo-lyase
MAHVPVIVWFRNDLRVSDNPALQESVQRGGVVVPLFIWAPEEEGGWPPGGASRWWLHQSLDALSRDLEGLGSRLIIRRGDSLRVLLHLAKETGARAVFWNRRYEPASIARDTRVKVELAARGLEAKSFKGSLLQEPWEVKNQTGKPYQVFTPFWRACLAGPVPPLPLAAPGCLKRPRSWPESVSLLALELEPKIDWAAGLREAWQPGSQGARAKLRDFLAKAWLNYDEGRNRPDRLGTSRLSPHLHFGEISPRQVWHQVRRYAEQHDLAASAWQRSQFLAELGWREFAHHLLYHFPHTPSQPLRPEFARFPWRKNQAWLRRWQRGQTGYPIVDAGMRELWTTGWMHNRVRMIVASFLVKDLLLPWSEGARWFWDTLVDADLANNTLGWQWSAGCGADAAPYFRIFNPIAQGERFDPQGAYVRRWVPELSRLPDHCIHRPWETPAPRLAEAGPRLGRDYPSPIVKHAIARETALEAYHTLRRS